MGRLVYYGSLKNTIILNDPCFSAQAPVPKIVQPEEPIAEGSVLTQMERPGRLFLIAPPRPVQPGVQIVSIEDRNRYRNIEENVRKLTPKVKTNIERLDVLP